MRDKKWDVDCTFSEKTLTFLNQDGFSDALDGLDQIEQLTGTLIIDNTPLPKGGAWSTQELITMVTIRTDFEMKYNIKTLTIYGGLVCLLLLFTIFGQIYVCCKMRRDTNAKRAKLADEYADTYTPGKLLPKTE